MQASKVSNSMRMHQQALILNMEPIEGVLSATHNVGQSLG